MSPHDFTMWALGFVETVEGRPTRAQWQLFKTKHAEVVGRLMKDKLLATQELAKQYPDPTKHAPQRVIGTPNTANPVGPPPWSVVATGTTADLFIGTSSTTAAGISSVDSAKTVS